MSQLSFELRFPDKAIANEFFITTANQLAMGWLNQWPDWPAPYRSLNIYGPKGCGKSQLGLIFSQMNNAHILQSLRVFRREDVKDSTVFILDNVAQTEDWNEEALFHFMNYLAETNSSSLLLSHEPLSQIEWQLADLQSRMRSLTAQAVELPDDDLLEALLVKYFELRQCQVAPPVLRYILTHMERSYEAAAEMAVLIDKASLAAKKPVTMALVRDIIK